MTTVTIKSGDTAIEFTSTLVIVSDDEWSLTNTDVRFLLKKGNIAYSFDATVVDANARTVKYIPGAGFPKQPGKYIQEWEVTFSNDTTLTFPCEGANYVIIENDLN